MSNIIKLYRETVASKKLGQGRKVSVTQTKVLGTSTDFTIGNRAVKARGYNHGKYPRTSPITGQQFRAQWSHGRCASSPVLGAYSAAKQRLVSL